MLYSPTIVDATIAQSLLLTGAASLPALTVAASFSSDITLPLLVSSASLLVPAAKLSSEMTLPLLAGSLSLLAPTVVSSAAVIPSTTTGVASTRRRIPNPYCPTEMRRAMQMEKAITVDNTALIATINETLLGVLSDLAAVSGTDIPALDTRIDTLEEIVASYSAEADSNVVAGQPVYVKANTHVDLAKADAAATCKVAGLATETKSTGHAVKYISDGKQTLADWTAIVGVAALTPGADYYLSKTTVGQLTTVAPLTVGEYVVRVGRAVSTTILDVEISEPILL